MPGLICTTYEWYENCPFSVMESQMYGAPVLGANIGGIPELIRVGETGELFEYGNAEQLKEKISSFWENRKRLVDRFGKNDFTSVESYSERLLNCVFQSYKNL